MLELDPNSTSQSTESRHTTIIISSTLIAHLKNPREREFWVDEGNQLQEHFDSPNVSMIAISEINVLSFNGHLFTFVSDSFKDLGQASSSHWLTVKTTKEFGQRNAKIFFKQQLQLKNRSPVKRE